jgi:recombination associated protein RdgC
MGLLKGTVTFSRYRVVGGLPDHFPEFFNERIRRYAFQNVWRTSDEKAAGWTSVENPLDTDFPFASYAQGRYMLFDLREDRKAVPPSLLKIRIMEAERKTLAESGQKKLYREQRDAIKESIRLDLLGKTLPVPSFYEICWSVPDSTLTFCSLSDKVSGELQELFKESFSLSLAPWTPLDPASPSLPPGIDPLTVGREFLTWLWFKSEERSGKIRIHGDDECELLFVRRLVLEAGEGEYAETIVCQGLHADLKEGKEALRQGKKISAARLHLAYDKEEWEFTFKADRFHFQSMKLPSLTEADGEEADREGQILERLYLIEKAAGMMDRLFGVFMDLRRAGWEDELSRMQRWIAPQ